MFKLVFNLFLFKIPTNNLNLTKVTSAYTKSTLIYRINSDDFTISSCFFSDPQKFMHNNFILGKALFTLGKALFTSYIRNGEGGEDL